MATDFWSEYRRLKKKQLEDTTIDAPVKETATTTVSSSSDDSSVFWSEYRQQKKDQFNSTVIDAPVKETKVTAGAQKKEEEEERKAELKPLPKNNNTTSGQMVNGKLMQTQTKQVIKDDDVAPVKEGGGGGSFDTASQKKSGSSGKFVSYADEAKKDPEFSKYAKQGAQLANPSFEDASKGISIFGWKPFAEKVGNPVTFVKANSDAIRLDVAMNNGTIKGINYLWANMTDDEVSVYNYYLAKYGEEKAGEYLDSLNDELSKREGTSLAENVNGKAVAEVLVGAAAGLDNSRHGLTTGLKNFVTGGDEKVEKTPAQYQDEILAQDNEGAMKIAHDSAAAIGNMLPSIAAGILNPAAGAVVMGAGVAGNKYNEMIEEGYSVGEARVDAALTGLAEAGLQSLFGGIGMLGGKAGGKLLSKVAPKAADKIAEMVYHVASKNPRIVNALGNAIKEMGKEAAEEALQTYLEPAIDSWVTKEEYDTPEFEEVMYNALIGAVTSGVLEGAPSVGKATVNTVTKPGVNAQGNTKDEQSVIDKVTEDRVAEKEKGGEKLTFTEKQEIAEKVKEDMEKGYISTDTIEEVLGGDEHKAYTDAVAQEDALRKEYEELGALEKPTLAQKTRFEELHGTKDSFMSDDNRNALREKVSESVRERVKNSRLSESYNERARRGQYFDDDPSAYKNENARKTVENLVGSKLANNTRRTRELADTVVKIAEDKGITFDFTNNEKIKADGKAYISKKDLTADGNSAVFDLGAKNLDADFKPVVTVDGETVSGFSVDYASGKVTFDSVLPANAEIHIEYRRSGVVNGFYDSKSRTVTVNMDSPKAWQFIVGHEVTHSLEGTDAYNELQDAIKKYAETKGDYSGRKDALSSAYNSGTDIDTEITSDLVGEYLFTDEEFVNQLSANNRNLFQKIYDEIKHLYKMVTAGSKEARELERVKHAFEKAYRAKTDAKAGTKYSVYLNQDDIPNYLKAGTRQNKNRQARYEEGQQIIVSSDEEFDSFIMKSIKGTHNEMVAYGKVEDALAKQVEEKSDSKIDISNAYLELLSDDVYHAYREHSKAKHPGDMDMSIDDLIHALKNVNQSEVVSADQYKDGRQHVLLAIPADDGTMVMVEVASKSAGTLRLKTGWKVTNEKFAQKKRSSTSVAGSISSTHTARDNTASDVIIPQNSEKSSGNAENVATTEDQGEQYSLDVDSDGNKITAEQREYFKNSKVRDENGSLKVMYHGTPNGVYTVFRDGTYFTDNKAYADLYQNPGASSISVKRDASAPKTYKVYLDIKKPFDISDPVARKIYINDYIKGGNAVGINPYLSDAQYDQLSSIDWTEGEDLREFLQDNGYDYDGLVLDEGATGGYGDDVKSRGTSYVIFSPEQVKSVYNASPTSDPDINYSISLDSDGRELSGSQKEYFADSKVRDDNGALKIVYHGSGSEFYEFSYDFMSAHGSSEGQGFYFTDSEQYAKGYQRNGTKLLKGYLDIKKPLSDSEITIKRNELSRLLKAVDPTGDDVLINYDPSGGMGYPSRTWYSRALAGTVDSMLEYNSSDSEILADIANSGAGTQVVLETVRNLFGYDGYIVKGKYDAATIYVAFASNQFKNIDNVTPTEDPDFRRSISTDIAPSAGGDWRTPARELRYAGGSEDIAPTVGNNGRFDRFIAEVEKGKTAFSIVPDDYYAPIPEEEANAMQDGILDSLDDSDAPPEMEVSYYGDEVELPAPADPFEEKDISEVGKRSVKAYMYENPEVKPFFQKEAEVMLGEMSRTIKGERVVDANVLYETNGEAGVWGVSRSTSADIEYLLDTWHYTYAEIEKGLKAIIEDNGAENNAVSKRIEFLLSDRLSKGYIDFGSGIEIPPDQGYLDLLREKEITEYNEEAFQRLLDEADEGVIPPEEGEDIAPVVKTPTAEKPKPIENEPSVGTPIKNEPKRVMSTVAEVLTEEPKVKNKRRGLWSLAKEYVLDNGMVFEEVAKENNNRELEARWNSIRNAPKKAQHFIENGADGTRSVNAIRKEVEKRGILKQLSDYMYHMHNIDRMSLESKARAEADQLMRENPMLSEIKASDNVKDIIAKIEAKTLQMSVEEAVDPELSAKNAEMLKNKESVAEELFEKAQRYAHLMRVENKPVFGDTITADVSYAKVQELLAKNPELKQYAEEIYQNNRYLRSLMVEEGVISYETAKLWEEMYPHYVPVRREGDFGLNVNVPLDTRRTGINAPVKGATGGSRNILPLFDTLGIRAIQTYNAIAKNRFGIELMDTLGSTVESNASTLEDAIGALDQSDSLLKAGENGMNPTFTVFDGGEKVTFEITEEMYDAMRPAGDVLSYTNKVANTASNIFRGLLTEYNPVFIVKNAIKDVQDVFINSQHPLKTYWAIPRAIWEMADKGKYYREYLENGGENNTYFERETSTFVKDGKVKAAVKTMLGLNLISKANNIVEMAPRLAEYIASRRAGRSIDVSMLDAARVTTNFAAGGKLTKFLNRNGATFLSASVNGAVQQARNLVEAKQNGLKGFIGLAAKFIAAGLPMVLLNDLIWDDDDEYEELSDYVKQNYYIVGKFGDGKFVRIPKGRTVAVIQDAFVQMEHRITGDDEADLRAFLELAFANLAPNNPIEDNIIAPIKQVVENKTWYGEDLVPQRLQDLPAGEQYDESTDELSRWLGEKFDFISPYKVNYLLNQYTGGVGDVVLPMLTPEAESGDDSVLSNLFAPLRSTFTTDSVMNNQNVSDFYDKKDELTKNAKGKDAKDEDVLMNKYINSMNAEISELYAQKREIQSSSISDDVKYKFVRQIQDQIVDLTRKSLNTYEDIRYEGEYAVIGDRYFKKDSDGEWQKLSDDQVTKHKVTSAAGDEYYATDGNAHYRLYVKEGETEGEWRKVTDKELEKQKEVTHALGISPEEYWEKKDEYTYAYENPSKYQLSKAVGGYDAYKGYSSEMNDIKADKDADGKSISGSRKEKVLDYINGLDADYGAKIILFKSEYPADDTYNNDIIDYLNGRDDISYEQMVTILRELGFKVSGNDITW